MEIGQQFLMLQIDKKITSDDLSILIFKDRAAFCTLDQTLYFDLEKKNINLFDFDKDKLPNDKFDVIISLYSLDYHYDFEIYKDYLLKVLKPDSILILDTVRPGYFNEIFNKIDVEQISKKN